jgi:hypothetical protein
MSTVNEPAVPPDFRVPVVRHFIACDAIDSAGRGKYSLHNVIYAIKVLPGEAYPQIHPMICLFAHMTNGRGSHSFQIDLVFTDDGQSTYTSELVTIDLGDDPLAVYGWPIRLRNLLLPHPGLYEFRLLCDGRVIAREPILLREIP